MAETEPTTHEWRSELPGDPTFDDIARRWMASDRQRAEAKAAILATPGARIAYVPITLVGKSPHVWSLDIEIEHPQGVWTSRNGGDEGPDPRMAAEDAAYEALEGRVGCASYGVVWPDGHAAVFEGFRRITGEDEH